ncbi:unnamed protein product [Gordionus sp. m RMFG-2023]
MMQKESNTSMELIVQDSLNVVNNGLGCSLKDLKYHICKEKGHKINNTNLIKKLDLAISNMKAAKFPGYYLLKCILPNNCLSTLFTGPNCEVYYFSLKRGKSCSRVKFEDDPKEISSKHKRLRAY